MGDARASFRLSLRRRVRGQLQHRRVLTYAQMREQHDLAIGELDGIVVRTWIVQIDLPEPPNPMRDVPRFPLEKTQEKSGLRSLDFAIERDLGARKKAHRHLGVSNCGESVCRGVPKLRRNQLVSNLRRP